MALKKLNTENTNANAAAAVEDAPATAQTQATAQAAETAAATQADAATASVAATTAIAKASAGSVVTNNEGVQRAKQFKKEVEAMQGAADFSYGAHRVFKASNGTIVEMKEPKLDLGRWVHVQLLAWDRHFEVSPGSESKESAGFVGYSKDGVTIDSVVGEELQEWVGKSVNEYLEYLRKEEDFDQASKREFIDTQVAVLGSENEPEFHEIAQITLSSSSIPAFKSYQSQLEGKAKAAAMGLPGFTVPENPFAFYFLREAAEKGKNKWTKLRIVSTLPAKI